MGANNAYGFGCAHVNFLCMRVGEYARPKARRPERMRSSRQSRSLGTSYTALTATDLHL